MFSVYIDYYFLNTHKKRANRTKRNYGTYVAGFLALIFFPLHTIFLLCLTQLHTLCFHGSAGSQNILRAARTHISFRVISFFFVGLAHFWLGTKERNGNTVFYRFHRFFYNRFFWPRISVSVGFTQMIEFEALNWMNIDV